MAEYLYSSVEGKKTRLDVLRDLIVRQKTAILISIILLIGASAIFYFLQEKDYKAAAVLTFDDNVSIYLSENQNLDLNEELNYLSSEEFLRNAASRIVSSESTLNLFLTEKKEIPSGDTSALIQSISKKLSNETEFELNRNSLIAYIQAPTQQGALFAAERLAETYAANVADKFDNSSKLTSFLDEKINHRKNELEKNQRALNNYKSENRTVMLAGRYLELIKNISLLEAELEKKEIERQLSQLLLDDYRKVLTRIDGDITESIFDVEDNYIAQLKEKISDLKAENNLRKEAQTNSQNQLSANKNELKTEVKNYIDDLIENKNFRRSEKEIIHQFALNVQLLQINERVSEKSKAGIYDQLTNYENQFGRIPGRSSDLAVLTRKTNFDRQVLSKLEELEESEDWTNYASVNNFAGLSYDVTLVGKTGYGIFYLLLIGLGAGLVIGLIVAIGLNSFFSSVSDPKDIDSFGLKLIAIIPRLKSKNYNDKKSGNDEHLAGSLLFSDENYQLAEESFKRLEEYLKNAFLDKAVKSLIITSPIDGDGKSVIAANLAITIANRGANVLLVDANMRDPSIAEMFSIDSSASLPHYLFKKKEFNEIIINTHVPNLKIIPSIEFNQNLSLVLSSKRMKSFMRLVNAEYDYVIYDTPSINNADDALLISDNVDETIVITRDEKTSFDDLKKTLAQFDANEVSVGGVVLNGYEMRKLSPEYEEYYGFNHSKKSSKKDNTEVNDDINLPDDVQFNDDEDGNKNKIN